MPALDSLATFTKATHMHFEATLNRHLRRFDLILRSDVGLANIHVNDTSENTGATAHRRIGRVPHRSELPVGHSCRSRPPACDQAAWA